MKTLKIAILLWAVLAQPMLAGEISPADLTRLPAADVVVLGEIHDNADHHANQLAAVRALQPAALVFEMLTPQAADGQPLRSRDPAVLAQLFAPGWQADFYVPILLAAAADTPIYGAEVPRADVRRAMAEGVASVFAEATTYGLDQPLAAADQRAREADQLSAHCDAIPPEMLAPLVAGQRLRDASLAKAVMAAVAARPSGSHAPVVVITGAGHARKDRGMPVFLAKVAPDLRLVSIGQIEGDAPPDALYDLWLRSPAVASRDDPCAAFKAKDLAPAPQ